MASADELRRRREDESAFAFLYDMARQHDEQLAAEGRRPVFGGLLSKEPVAGVDTVRYEGMGNMLAGLLSPVARAVDAPISAYRGTIPQEDMLNEAMNVYRHGYGWRYGADCIAARCAGVQCAAQ